MSDEIKKYNETVQLAIISDVMQANIAGSSIDNACEKAGISRSTFYRWLKDGVAEPYFQQLRDSRMAEMDLKVASALPDVVDHLISIATGAVEQRGANPIQAAKLLMQIIGVNQRGNVGSTDPEALARLSRVPNFIQFNIVDGAVRRDVADDEVLEGEVISDS